MVNGFPGIGPVEDEKEGESMGKNVGWLKKVTNAESTIHALFRLGLIIAVAVIIIAGIVTGIFNYYEGQKPIPTEGRIQVEMEKVKGKIENQNIRVEDLSRRANKTDDILVELQKNMTNVQADNKVILEKAQNVGNQMKDMNQLLIDHIKDSR